MLICTLAVLLLAMVAAIGYFQGAVRLSVSLFGLLLGAMLAFPLAPTMNKLVALIGVKHPVWAWVWPPIFAFLIVYLVFLGISFLVHHKVYLHFKYRSDDTALYQWERMNRRLGACLGLVAGSVWFFLIGLVIHIAGYLSVQVASEEGSSSLLRYLSQAKQELRTTGLERSVAALDPMPPAYYQVSDILGLIYQNPILISRLSQYPPFLTLGERTEFQEIASDKDYINLLLTKADVSQIVSHPKTQALILSPEIVQELLQQDLKDLRQYLETGISPKYDEEKILGVWNIDLYTTVAQVRKKLPNISASDMRQLRKKMSEELPGATLKATTDKKVTFKAPGVEAARQAAAAAAAAQAARQPSAGSGGAPTMSPEMARRYGLGPSGNPRAAAPPPAAVPQPAANVPPPLVSAGQGTWQKNADNYELRIQNDKGREFKVLADTADGRLTIQVPPPLGALVGTLVFVKAD